MPLLLAALGLTALMIAGGLPAGSAPHAEGAPPPSIPHAATGAQVMATNAVVPSAQQIPGLSLGITAQPKAICAFDGTSCPAGVGMSRVTLTAQASPNGIETWPAVQVAFVVETTAYDGVYDPSASDPGDDTCAQANGVVCEESNGVPFFVAHAQQIADAIQAANPHSQVTFAMVDYFATLDHFDDGDGSEYHVDIPQFIGSGQFGSAVQGTFQAEVLGGGYIYSDSDLSDNVLHSSMITALFGTIIGSGLDWSPNTHHVIVWMGSTAPRDPNYQVDYGVSSSSYSNYCAGSCLSPTCEPAYTFGSLSSPNCEGWIRAQDGNLTHSIAELAKTSPTCTDSIGGVCTVDMIDLYNGITDPWSKQWTGTSTTGGGPGGTISLANAAKIMLAGCDLAAATGGTWDGPNFFTCPTGQQGELDYMPFGTPTDPNLANPSLLQAFRQVGFGPVETTLVANGTEHPLFQFVPWGKVELAPGNASQIATVCTLPNGLYWHGGSGPDAKCPSVPQVLTTSAGETYYGWNWSNNASQNAMYVGDSWEVSFNIVANGPPYARIPVDDCIAHPSCQAAGSTTSGGVYTAATYLPVTNHTAITESFPVAQITVETTPLPAPGAATPPPAPPPPPGLLVPIAPGIPALVGIGLPAQVGVANAALQATAAGLLAAGFIRVSQRNRPISLAVAALSGKGYRSKFDVIGSGGHDAGIGRFE